MPLDFYETSYFYDTGNIYCRGTVWHMISLQGPQYFFEKVLLQFTSYGNSLKCLMVFKKLFISVLSISRAETLLTRAATWHQQSVPPPPPGQFHAYEMWRTDSSGMVKHTWRCISFHPGILSWCCKLPAGHPVNTWEYWPAYDKVEKFNISLLSVPLFAQGPLHYASDKSVSIREGIWVPLSGISGGEVAWYSLIASDLGS